MTEPVPPAALSALGLIRRALPILVTLLLSLSTVVICVTGGGHNDQRFIQVGFLLLATLIIIGSGRLAGPWTPSYAAGGALLVLAALGVASSLASFSPLHGLQEVATLALLVLTALYAGREMAVSFQSSLRKVLRLIGAGCILYAVQIVVVWVASLATRSQPDLFTFSPGFSNFRFVNHAQTVVLPLLALACCLPNIAHRKAWLVLSALAWALLFLLGGRGTMIGMLAGVLAAAILRRSHARALCRTMAFAALGGLVLYWILFTAIPLAFGMQPFGEQAQLIERSIANPTSSRIALWGASVVLIAAHPVLGIGPMHYAHELKDSIGFGHPHDWVLQIGAEWGVPALLLLIYVVYRGMRGLLRCAASLNGADQPNQLAATAWIAIGAAIVVDGLVSGLIVMPASQMLIALYLGCASGWYWSMRPPPAQPDRPGANLAFAAMLAGAAAIVVASIALDPPSSGPAADAIHYPRYWLNGSF